MDYILQKDGSLQESPELIKQRLQAALAPFGVTLEGIPAIKHSDIVDMVLKRELAVVTYDSPRQLLAHLKHTILRWARAELLSGRNDLSWEMTDPKSIVEAAFGTGKDYGDKDPDPVTFSRYLHTRLLVIRAVDFPRARSAQEQITYVLKVREEFQRPTIFCCPTLEGLFCKDPERNDMRLGDMLARDYISLDLAEFEQEIIQPSVKRSRK